MGHCPSHEWDAVVADLEAQAEAERAFFQANGDRILAVVCAAITSRSTGPVDAMPDEEIRRLVDGAAKIVLGVVGRGEPEA